MLKETLLTLAAATAAWAQPIPPPRDVTAETLANPKALARLQRPGKVLFEDGFESEASFAKWFEVRGRKEGRARLVTDPGAAHRGRGAIEFVAPDRGGKASGAGASAWLGKKGHEVVSFRRYLRFAEDYDQGNLHHTGGGLAGVAGTGKWDEMGKAGIRPKGDDSFTCGFETWKDWGRSTSPGYWFLYTYWMDMKRSGDGNWWGNMLQPAASRRVVPPRGKWLCLEHMIRVNTLGRADGELAAWLDGKLYLHLKGFRWRTVPELRIKRFSIGIYVHAAERENRVRYDDVVVSTGYVGPAPEAENGRKSGRKK